MIKLLSDTAIHQLENVSTCFKPFTVHGVDEHVDIERRLNCIHTQAGLSPSFFQLLQMMAGGKT